MENPSVDVNSLKAFPPHRRYDSEVQEEMLGLWELQKKFIILSGPPGVGKTKAAEDFIWGVIEKIEAPYGIYDCRLSNLFPNFKTRVYSDAEILSVVEEKNIKFVWDISVLHPQYTYEDLIRGYQMVNEDTDSTLAVREGVLGFMARATQILEKKVAENDLPVGCLILDEINRAPIGQLFGEAIYALDRRGIQVVTPYYLEGKGNQFVIPDSLLILGTMNSVDRAVSGFDFALRRRFTFITMVPLEKPIVDRYADNEVSSSITLTLFNLFRNLVQNSSQTGTVPLSELVLGHAYFLAPESLTEDGEIIKWLAKSMKYNIYPTLLDYIEQGLLEFDAELLKEIPQYNVLLGEISLGEINESEIDRLLRTIGSE